MAYNYGPPPGAYGAPQQPYGPPSGQSTGGMGAPGFAAPGMDFPGMPSQSPAGVQGQFQPPPNMPNINFNAPVIRLGVDGQRQGQSSADRGDRGGRDGGRGSNAEPLGNRSRPGLGADPGRERNLERDRQQLRENMMALQPPTREEVARTIFIGGLGEGMPNDEALESILRCAGKLRRWTRARDANDRKCKFGFAEYEDVESLEAAAEIFQDVQVPQFKQDGSLIKVKIEDEVKAEIKAEDDAKDEDGVKVESGEQEQVQKAQLLVVVDDASREYIEEWKGRKKEADNDRQFRLDSCKELLDQTLSGLVNEAAYTANGINGEANGDRDGDVQMGENGETKSDGVEVVNLPVGMDDELADIPAEMRATVAEEIKAFRDRSNRRDLERLRREEEVEQEEKRRAGAPRQSRLASPPPSAQGNSANGIPVGPRGQQGVQGAPSGPKGYRGAQLPEDYRNGVAFLPSAGNASLHPEDEDANESDEELERRRQKEDDEKRDKEYEAAVNKWHARERTRGAAKERELKREEGEQHEIEKAREAMLIRLANWNDDEEVERAKHPYYRDRAAWARAREYDRDKEQREDDLDREAEEREIADEQRRVNEARGQANDFLGSLGVDTKAGDQAGTANRGLKFSLGAAAAKTKQAQPGPKRAMQDVEGLLEDEEDAAAAGAKRPELKPLQDTSTLPTHGQDLTDEEKQSARMQLAAEIPTDTQALFDYPVKWEKISKSLLASEIRPFVEKKVVEYLGVQEDLVVDTVLDGVKAKQKPQEIVDELAGPLEDEAEVLIKKVWRLLVFWGECESRGLSG
ncbi:RNA-binding 25 [Lecanosticta acicola]|uniref:RNA-binding 25 n=1 Tax=Lecanosticta acicola TaxID=111012 RepID=A0AAI8Z2J6_9PEZI|nr:RNA-binding 25 [Lecanosticta acicola]